MASQIAATSLPSPHIPPMPVMTTRLSMQSGFFRDQFANRLDHVADVFEVAPGVDRVHLDLDAVPLLEVEDDLGQLQRVDTKCVEIGAGGDFLTASLGMRLDLFDDFARQLVSHSVPSPVVFRRQLISAPSSPDSQMPSPLPLQASRDRSKVAPSIETETMSINKLYIDKAAGVLNVGAVDMIDDILVSPPAAQRVAGRGRLFCGKSGGRTRLQRLYQDGSAKIRMPAVQGDPLEAVLINTA